jgi:hypothetical protein
MKPPKLNRSDRRRMYDANRFWFLVALWAIRLRRGPKQLELLLEGRP